MLAQRCGLLPQAQCPKRERLRRCGAAAGKASLELTHEFESRVVAPAVEEARERPCQARETEGRLRGVRRGGLYRRLLRRRKLKRIRRPGRGNRAAGVATSLAAARRA